MTHGITHPPDWIPVTTQRGPHTLDLPAEPTPTPGLAIAPAWHGNRWTSCYTVVHTASGRFVPHTQLPLPYAREVADHLGRHHIDWTGPAEVLWTQRATLITVTDAAIQAWQDGIPLEWGRSSWRPCPPLWRLHGVHDPIAEDGPGLDHGEAWTTWRGAVGWLDLLHDNAFAAALPDTVTVERDEMPSWQLVCGAPACHAGQPATAVWFDAYGDLVERPTNDRALLADAALAYGWRQHGRHWLCPPCGYDYRPCYDTLWW